MKNTIRLIVRQTDRQIDIILTRIIKLPFYNDSEIKIITNAIEKCEYW